ncbi:hypothetical protein ACFLRF_04820 [Candidatus Altiarchaeota archaeon]
MMGFLKPSKGKALVFNLILLTSVLGALYIGECHSMSSTGGIRVRIPCFLKGTVLDSLLFSLTIVINLPAMAVLGFGPDIFVVGMIRVLEEFASGNPARSMNMAVISIIFCIIYICYWWILTCVLAKVYDRVKKRD